MTTEERFQLLRQIMSDYSYTPEEVDAVLKNEKSMVGHYTKEMLFVKLLESYSWYTVLKLLPVNEIQDLLTQNTINKLRSPALRKQYTYVRKRLQEIASRIG